MTLTIDILKKLCPNNKLKNLQAVTDALNEVCPLYKIDTADIMHEFLANLLEECGQFTRFDEDLRYSAKRMHEVWPGRFPTIESAKPYEYAPQLLAAKVYDGRKSIGNVQAGDGYAFRGSGPIQGTGRGIFTEFGAYMLKTFGIKKIAKEWAELCRTDIKIGIHFACWFFAIAKQLIDEAINDYMITIVKRINGGTTNLSKRLKYYDQCKMLIL